MDIYVKREIEIQPCCTRMEKAFEQGYVKTIGTVHYSKMGIHTYIPEDGETWNPQWIEFDFCLFCGRSVRIHNLEDSVKFQYV